MKKNKKSASKEAPPGDKPGKSKKKGTPKARPSRPTQFGQTSTLSWMFPGKLISEFFADNRLREKKVTFIAEGSMENSTIEFNFKVASDNGLGYIQKNLTGKGYQAFLMERKNNHRVYQEEQSWLAYSSKLKTRLGQTVTKPELFGEKARTVIRGFLTPFERQLMNLSQKEWANVDLGQLTESHRIYGRKTIEDRFTKVNEIFGTVGASIDFPTFDGDHAKTFKKKTVADMLAKKTEPTGAVAEI